MTQFLVGKRVLLGVTGSIAAYKSPEIIRRLREAGAEVRVAMTENAKRFITPLTLQAVSGNPLHEALFDARAEAAMGHIELARWADAVLIAPATADFMARLAHGLADDLLTTLCLATQAPVALAPAMNQGMWKHLLTQENLRALQQKQVCIIGPGNGSQACGDVGPGRMAEPEIILEQLSAVFATAALAGLKVLVTAGPTHEAIDPVRFLTNGSSGKMGYALAEAAREAGAAVTLISGPVSLPKPGHMDCMSVTTAQEMYDAVMRKIPDCDIFLSVAAVGDYRCKKVHEQKIHKNQDAMTLELVRNPDIVASVGQLSPRPFIVGFAAETEHVIEQAQAKRERKGMDMIVANQVGRGAGMGADENEVTVIGKSRIHLPSMPKGPLARQLIMMIAKEYHNQ
ncbi:Coenzyme A biosynthesis bifunctional protein CoaBC [Aquicella siphonis]|uniref:Coenzyme A biosynthesis bifunctional protein CoaBC n=2 Tax=Aquicella siphonis TaxID=254247 RepID=A0A5E4PDC6_9COXI|nr:bifunctional phosphopantothenoylcysteine decarboxylase/phosphopantothenate--cysteine ligase CoaBC [Aquicella siphonis]VVC74900.1 Coenzyme A biosynthesis bifunctional protein CoaBC [Aquicella siphonis]